MKKYTVYYYIAGETYREGDEAHHIHVEVLEMPIVPAVPASLMIAAFTAIELLKQQYPNDQHIIVRVEKYKYWLSNK